ncbi:armadillo-type protein [Rhodocollybia butyracea]|uniref:Armadillo-type protein n=1 Tax=Rhodocollybia butyracea TaxID=206335 RepID=A0A9P5Q412_9AGAR|nr:armadillo-type protein [Rhodocollybia butyracea]
MDIPDISSLNLHDRGPSFSHLFPDGIETEDDRYLQKLKSYAKMLPYSIESQKRMMDMLDFIILRLVQCVEAKDYDVGLLQWDSLLTYWSMLKYPIPKDKRIALAKIYFHVSITSGMPAQIIAICADAFKTLTQSKKKISIDDLRLPWKPIYKILSQDLFLSRRQFEYTQLSWCMGYIAENARRFFHPAAINEMLSTFIPLMNGSVLDTILSSQYYLLSFLPLTHPQSYLPMLLRMWESINSYKYDERMLSFLSKLAEMHVSPNVSDPRNISSIPDDERSEDEGRPCWSADNLKEDAYWPGLYKDVGIFTEHEWSFLMCKCLASMEIPLADAGSLTTGPSADAQASFEIGRLPKTSWRIPSLARIIVYSMTADGLAAPPSNAPTPMFSPLPSGMNTPSIATSKLGDYLSAPLGKGVQGKGKTYLAGSKALDSLARLIASVESFFHPTNSGAWTTDLSAFIKSIVYNFNKRWYEERQPECETPTNRRLTRAMKRELVKSLRTVVLLAMFSEDSGTVANIQSCLKSMCVMEPDLILHPILERAIPSLEALTETQRTIAVIKALGAVAPAIVCRRVYYPGAKHLLPILDLLIPGIDLNDPSKTLCTTAFLVEISQYIQFSDLSESSGTRPMPVEPEPAAALTNEFSRSQMKLPFFETNGFGDLVSDMEPRLSQEEEDILLKDTTASFADWVANFIRRVIQLMENLPEEGPNGYSGGATEIQVVDAVASACSQICVHLSEPLYDLVLKMVFDYASTNVRTNAVRAIHQLVECVANANPEKTLAMFLPFCARNIRLELENGASSLRTTSSSLPIPSDATLHWNLAILRGTVYNDGRAVVKYRNELMSLIKLLHTKTYSKRGFSWSGKFLSSMLLTLTHTYPYENKFVNPEEWESEEFRQSHHQHWGKTYAREDVTISWHVPNDEEIEFAIAVFKELVEPTLSTLDNLLDSGVERDATWRNDFCRHLSIARYAFSGIPTLLRHQDTSDNIAHAAATSDILDEIPEMVATLEPLGAGFCLTDTADPRYQYMSSLRQKFGQFLHKASLSLRQQGEENTVDAVHMLLSCIRTFMMDYGDSKDGYYANEEQYTSTKNVARLYAQQREWPRAVYVRRARFYHSARLRWNSIDRVRGPLEDSLIDDVTQWSMWHYAKVRIASQSLLESICSTYDGVRRRALPILYRALEPDVDDDDRLKGALWTLNLSSFGKYAISEPTLATELITKLLACQHNEKTSVQNCVATVFETCLGAFVEPSSLVYDIPVPALNHALDEFKLRLGVGYKEEIVTDKCRRNRIDRVQRQSKASDQMNDAVMSIAKSPKTHWRYAIVALKCLRTLARRDKPLTAAQMTYFLESIHDSQPSIRYYAQRAVLKTTRNLKLRTFCSSPSDLYEGRNQNPLKESLPVLDPTHALTQKFLKDYRFSVDVDQDFLFRDKNPQGWIAWSESIVLYKRPHPTKSSLLPWESASQEAVLAASRIATNPAFWKKLSKYLAEENSETSLTQDNVSCVKSIFQVLEDAPLPVLKPILEGLLKDNNVDKQRAAAEITAGVIGGSKHWALIKQKKLWEWLKPYFKVMFGQNLKSDTLSIWSSFLECLFYKTDPRRFQPLVDHLFELFETADLNTEMSFDAIKILSLFRSCYEELGWKFSAWLDDSVERCWREIHSDHDDVRTYIAELLAFADKTMWQPRPSIPTVEVFVKECRALPVDYDIMGTRGYNQKRVTELAQDFKIWRDERIAGVRAFQSKYDRVGILVCRWLFQAVHDTNAICVFDYILPLMPELFRFTEVNDNDELATRANLLLVRMCGVSPPRPLINPLLDAIFETIQSSPSWRVRLKALPLVQVFYFRQMPFIAEIKVVQMLEVLGKCLDDEVVEVREMAATTLSGVLRLSPRSSVLTLKNRFVRLAKNSHIPDKQDPTYNKCIRQRHAAILGICALVDSYPYTVEKWMPELLTNVLAEHTYDPIPISTTVRKCARNFKKTHQDTWHEDSKKFDDQQLAALSTLLTGSSYYA